MQNLHHVIGHIPISPLGGLFYRIYEVCQTGAVEIGLVTLPKIGTDWLDIANIIKPDSTWWSPNKQCRCFTILFEKGEMEVTAYAIRSYFNQAGKEYMKSWKVVGLAATGPVTIDERHNDSSLNDYAAIKLFQLPNRSPPLEQIHVPMTDTNWAGNHWMNDEMRPFSRAQKRKRVPSEESVIAGYNSASHLCNGGCDDGFADDFVRNDLCLRSRRKCHGVCVSRKHGVLALPLLNGQESPLQVFQPKTEFVDVSADSLFGAKKGHFKSDVIVEIAVPYFTRRAVARPAFCDLCVCGPNMRGQLGLGHKDKLSGTQPI